MPPTIMIKKTRAAEASRWYATIGREASSGGDALVAAARTAAGACSVGIGRVVPNACRSPANGLARTRLGAGARVKLESARNDGQAGRAHGAERGMGLRSSAPYTLLAPNQLMNEGLSHVVQSESQRAHFASARRPATNRSGVLRRTFNRLRMASRGPSRAFVDAGCPSSTKSHQAPVRTAGRARGAPVVRTAGPSSTSRKIACRPHTK